MIKVTGFFQNPASGYIYDSPTLSLVPHLEYAGIISMDVNIDGNKGTIPYQNIRQDLVYNDLIIDPHDKLLDALEVYVINKLSSPNLTLTRTYNYVPTTGDTNNSFVEIV
jgi:hypothetical protein